MPCQTICIAVVTDTGVLLDGPLAYIGVMGIGIWSKGGDPASELLKYRGTLWAYYTFILAIFINSGFDIFSYQLSNKKFIGIFDSSCHS